MSRTVMAISLLGVLAGLVVVGALHSRAAVTPLPGRNVEAMLYDGDLTADSGGIKVTYWGSGEAESTHEVQYLGPDVLKVTTEGPYQGVVLHMGRSADLAQYSGMKDALVDLRIKPAAYKRTKEEWLERVAGPETTGAGRGGGRGGAGGAGGARGGGGMRGGGGGGGMRGGGGGGGMRGGGGGGGMRGGGGGGGMRGGGRRGAAPGATQLADGAGITYQLEFTQMRGGGGGMRGGGGGMRGGGGGMRGGGGQRGGGGMRGGGGQRGGGAARGGTRGGQAGRGNQPGGANAPKEIGFTAHFMRLVLFTDRGEAVAQSVPIDDQWKDANGWYRVSYPLSRFVGAHGATRLQAVGVYTDEADTFYVGQVRLISEYAPVKATIKGDPANTTTGTVVDFSIAFSGGYLDPKVSWDFNDADGIQKQAAGTNVKYFYTKPGDYMVTATVEDRTGVQTAFQKQYGVHVEQGTVTARERQPNERPTITLEGTRKSSDEEFTIERGGSLEAK
jgi:hypothetical protein